MLKGEAEASVGSLGSAGAFELGGMLGLKGKQIREGIRDFKEELFK